MEKETEKEKNIIAMVNYYLKENIKMIKYGMENDMIKIIIYNMKSKMKKDLLKNMIFMVIYYLKVNMYMEKEIEKVKNMVMAA